MEINNQTLTEFRHDFERAMEQLQEKYKVTIELKKITYELNSFKGAIEVRKLGLDNAEWNWYCEQYGLKAEDLGKMFLYNHKWYKIVGIKRGVKFPIQTQREDGKSYSFTAELIKQSLA